METTLPIPSKYAKRSRKSLINELIELRSQISTQQAAGSDIAHKQSWDILESICDGFFACDSEWRFVYINCLAEKLLGFRRREMIGKIFWEVFPLTVGTKLEHEYRRAAVGEIRDFENFYEPWGRWFHNRCFPRQGGGMAVYFQDITEHKMADIALAEAKKQLEQTLASITDGYYALDDQWRFVALNPLAEDYFGKPAADLIGKDIWQETDTLLIRTFT